LTSTGSYGKLELTYFIENLVETGVFMATIRDIARLAGVSITTVSKVINNYPDIGERTRQKVIKIMEQENYHPNAIARSLSTNRSHSIGVFINYNLSRGLHHLFFHEILFGLETDLGQKGYDFIYFSDLKWKDSCDYVAKSKNRHVDGVVLMGIPLSDNHIDKLLKSSIPAVFLDVDIVGKNATYVTFDNVGGARQVVKYLYELGHREIGVITGLKFTKPAQDRLLGFQQAMNELDLVYKTDYIINTSFSEEGGHNAMEKILKMDKRPTAIFCHSDSIAIGAMRAIQEAGYRVPDDFSIVGFDDLQICTYINPKLTTVRQDAFLMGQKAAELLTVMMEQPDKSIFPVVLPTELIIRESCRKISTKKEDSLN
jgi:LacI family transcriptional regulator/LacI family purine nucleotide synthesis repressor